MWSSAPLVSRADVGGTISSSVESTSSGVEGTLGGVESTLGDVESTLGSVESTLGGVESTLGSVEGSSGGVEGTLGGVESILGSVESILGSVEGSSGGAEGILVDLQSASATTATETRAPALLLHRVEWQSGGSWDMDATMGAYRFRLSGSAGIAPCWVQT